MHPEDRLKLLESLSLAEREALEGVLLYKSSKEIGRSIGKSPKTIDQRLDRARIKLSADNRYDAARRYSELQSTWEGLPCGPSPIPKAVTPPPQPRGVPEDAVYAMSDAITFASDSPWHAAPRRDVPKVWDQDLGTGVRIALILAGGVAVLVLILLGLGVAAGLKDLIRGG